MPIVCGQVACVLSATSSVKRKTERKGGVGSGGVWGAEGEAAGKKAGESWECGRAGAKWGLYKWKQMPGIMNLSGRRWGWRWWSTPLPGWLSLTSLLLPLGRHWAAVWMWTRERGKGDAGQGGGTQLVTPRAERWWTPYRGVKKNTSGET